MSIISQAGNILIGHGNELFNLNGDISQKRLNICLTCPIYSPKLGGICNNKLWINPQTDDVRFEETPGYVRGCGCRLKAKTTIPSESCVAGKW